MEKKLKRLVLAKETVRNLDTWELGKVAGGLSANGDCTYTNCCSGLPGCGTTACGSGQTGGSKYC